MTPTKEYPVIAKLAFLLVSVFILFHGLYVASSILIPLASAFLLSLLLYPISTWLEKRRIPRGIAIIMSILVLITIVGGVSLIIINEFSGFYRELPELTERMNNTFLNLQNFIESNFQIAPEAQIAWLSTRLSMLLENSGDVISSFIFTTSGVLTQLGLIPIYIFFMLFYRDLFLDALFRATSEENHERLAIINQKIQKVIEHYIVGLFTVIVIVAVLNTSALLIIGVPHAFFFGILAALLTVIPYIGVFIGSIIPVLYSLAMTGDIWQPLWVFLAFSAIQSLEGNIISPRITGSKVSLNPLAAIVALLIGGSVWGIAGMIMFVPFTAMLKVIFDHVDPLKPYGILLGTQKDEESREIWKELFESVRSLGKMVIPHKKPQRDEQNT